MLLVIMSMNLLGRFAFHTSFSVNGLIVLIHILGATLLSMITVALVAYGSVQVRPLEVLSIE
jgi:hypothetical protein